MPITIRCASCGEEERLRGVRDGELLVITCEACEFTWARKPGASCMSCGSAEVLVFVDALVEKSRGTQLSVTGIGEHILCADCDAEELARHRARGGGRIRFQR
ncbi:MAG: hypothetical protein WEC34_02940 [Acidimicrobiia bacterium]